MKKAIIILALMTIIIGCNESEDNNIKYGDYIETGIELSIVNSKGEDLLNPEHPNHLKEEDIKLFYLEDGQTKEVYNPDMDLPRNFKIYKAINEYRIGIALNSSPLEKKAITYIQWNKEDTDTLEATFRRSVSSVVRDTVWLNGKQIYEYMANRNDNYYYVFTK